MRSKEASIKKWRRAAFWGLLILALDLGAKAAARRYFSPWEPLAIIPGFFNLVLTYNTGAAFSLLAGESGPGQGLKMAAIAAASLLPFIYFFRKAQPGERLLLTSLGLIWGGALGNIHDRLRWGAVVDFLDFHWGEHHWPAFNLADVGVCLGAGLLALSIWREKPPPGAAGAAPPPERETKD